MPRWKRLNKAPTKSYSATLVDPKSRNKTFHLFPKLPGELREQIYLYAFQSGPSVVYVTPKMHQPNSKRSHDRVSLVQGRLGYESKWKWAAEVAAVIPEATAAFERQFGKRSEVRHDQLRAVRPWDLVVYIFEPGTTESFGVQLAIDETLSREARERLVGKGQVRNVSVRYEREMPYPWFPPCQWDPSGFLHNFPDLENMSIQFLLNNSHMDSHREANMSPKEFVDSLVAQARKDPKLAVFQDRCRTWVEIGESHVEKWLHPKFVAVFSWIRGLRQEFVRDAFHTARLTKEKRRSVQFRVLVSSLYKVDPRSTLTAEAKGQ